MSNKEIKAWKNKVAQGKTIFVTAKMKRIHPVVNTIFLNNFSNKGIWRKNGAGNCNINPGRMESGSCYGLEQRFLGENGLGIPAGGVPVGVVFAENLHIPFEVAVVSKITLPWNSEAGYGAVAFDGTVKINYALIAQIRLSREDILTGIEKTTSKMATVLNFNRLPDKAEQSKGRVRKKPGSNKLYVDFYYHGNRIVKSTGLNDTQKNRERVQDCLDRAAEKIERGTFVFAEAFTQNLVWKEGKKKGRPLSASRVRNILIPFRSIWEDACVEHRWELSDPFSYLKKHLPKRVKNLPRFFVSMNGRGLWTKSTHSIVLLPKR
jgi:hypothetical protein